MYVVYRYIIQMSNFLVIKIFVLRIIVYKNSLTKILNRRNIGTSIYIILGLFLQIFNFLFY